MVAKKIHDGHPMIGYLGKDMRHIILKLVLVHRIAKKPIYSYALMGELDAKRISKLLNKKGRELKNDVYNTLGALEKSGYISSRERIEDGKKRNYYSVTPKGRKRLRESRMLFMKTMRELMNVMKE